MYNVSKEFFVSEKNIFLKTDQEYITLQAVLQISDVISTGGMAKAYLADNPVEINGEKENRRGRKLYPGDSVRVGKDTIVIEKQ